MRNLMKVYQEKRTSLLRANNASDWRHLTDAADRERVKVYDEIIDDLFERSKKDNDSDSSEKEPLHIDSVVSKCCEEIPEGSFFLGVTCPKCGKPFRNILK